MTIVLQTNKSEKNRVTKVITNIATKTGALRDSTSIINPTVRITGTMADYKACNYMTIEAFGRSYFVTDITSVGLNVLEVTGHCDVISSFATEILANRAVIARQAYSCDRYLDDSKFKIRQNNNVITAPLSGEGFTQAGYVLITAASST